MARTKAVLGAGARLSDYLSASLLARVYPATLIGEILDEHGCNSKRIRSLPAGRKNGKNGKNGVKWKKWGQTRYCDYTSSLSRFQCMKYHGPSSPLCDSWPATAHLLSTSKRGGVTEKGI
jgi:hypothetical protein